MQKDKLVEGITDAVERGLWGVARVYGGYVDEGAEDENST
jgi:hypothetical protein